MAKSCITTVDLSPFFREGDDDGRRAASEIIGQACSDSGFFQIVNHGIPTDLMSRALQLSKTFFQFPDDEKLKSSPVSGAPLPAGYSMQPGHSPDKNEYLMICPPGSSFNIYPKDPPDFKEVVEEMFLKLSKISLLLESIINDCLGLPPDCLKKYNNDRSCDILTALHYFPATEDEDYGLTAHEDSNCVTLVIQDEVGGLQVYKDGEWLPVTPAEGALVVNIGDVIQVLSNKRFKSATHRVGRPIGRSRYSFAFFHNLQGEKWVEPLPQFTKEIGEQPKYKGFEYKEYQHLRIRNKTHPPSRQEDAIHITHYEIDPYPKPTTTEK